MNSRLKRALWTIASVAGIIPIIFLASHIESCGQRERVIKLAEETRIENIVRVFMHEPGTYSFIIRIPGSNKLKQIRGFNSSPEIFSLIPDVPLGQDMWTRQYFVADKDSKTGEITSEPRPRIEIHVHSEKDIEGGGWNHGKFGRGQTTVVE